MPLRGQPRARNRNRCARKSILRELPGPRSQGSGSKRLRFPSSSSWSGPLPLSTRWHLPMTTSKQVGDPDHLKVFANAEAATAWFAENDPEGVAFEYEIIAHQFRS